MPKLLQITVSINRGSTGIIAEQIGQRALECGWESYVAYGNFNLGSKLQTIKIGGKWNKKMHALECRIFDNHGLASRLATLSLIKKIKLIKPDIIHLHNIHGYYINYKILFRFLKAYNKPVVWTLHDCWSMTGHCSHFVTANCSRWITGCHDCPLKSEYPSSLFLDRSKKNYIDKKESFTGLRNLTIIPVSQWLADIVRKSYLQYANIHVIRNGIDLSVFRPSQPKSVKGSFKVLSVSSVWNKDKGLRDFTRLREILPKEIKITLVGLKPEQLKYLPDGVDGICRTDSRQELVDLYSQSNVLVNTTYADTFPTVNLEALACGTPVVTYNTGGSPEAIDSLTGIVVPQGDIKALADAILRIQKSPLSSDECRKRAEYLFDKNICFANYIEIYNRLYNNV